MLKPCLLSSLPDQTAILYSSTVTPKYVRSVRLGLTASILKIHGRLNQAINIAPLMIEL